MPKGRVSNPSIATDGNWYKHRNCNEYLDVGPRSLTTSTGFMTSEIAAVGRPADPPVPFERKHQTTNTKLHRENPFSHQDNQNVIQLKGEYLGDGRGTRNLGRRLYTEDINLHRTEPAYLKHRSIRPDPIFIKPDGAPGPDSFFHSNYMLSHTHKSAPAAEKRRFPKKHPEPPHGEQKLSTMTACQFRVDTGDLPFCTSNQTLVSSIEPFVKKNSWKYAYNGHGKYDIYPKVWGDRRDAQLATAHFPKRQIIVNKVARECTL